MATNPRVTFLRALNLGDLLCAVPAVRALRASMPSARFTLVGLAWSRPWFSRFGFDDFIEWPGFPGLPEIPARLDEFSAFLERVRAQHFDLAVQMHGCGTLTNPLVALFGARRSAGYFVPGQYHPEGETFAPWPESVPEVWRWLGLAELLGAPSRGEQLEFPVLARDERELEGILGDSPRPYVCLHPGARDPARRWAPEHFARVGDEIRRRGFEVILTGGSEESALTAEVAANMECPARDLAGRTSLGCAAALLHKSSLLVCNDTGVSHLAAALRTPSVVVFTRSEFLGWPPLDRQLHRCVSRLNGPVPSEVVEQADALLERNSAHAAAAHPHLARPRKLPLVPRSFPS